MGRPKEIPLDSKPTSIRVSSRDVLLIETEFQISFSEFVRACTDGALSQESDVCPTCGNIRNNRTEQATRIGQKIRHEKRTQRKIITAQEEAEQYRQERQSSVATALKEELKRQYAPRQIFDDPNGDYYETFNEVLGRVSGIVGSEVLPTELLKAWKVIQGSFA